MKWFYMISHPFMSTAQPKDPSRHPPCSITTHLLNQMLLNTERCTCWCRPVSTCSGKLYFQLRLLLNLCEHALTLNFFLLFFDNFLGGLPSNSWKIGKVAQPKNSDQRNKNIHCHRRMPKDCKRIHSIETKATYGRRMKTFAIF